MPRGVPTLGSRVGDLTQTPQAEVLGEIKAKGPTVTAWETDDAGLKRQIEIEEGPAPWGIVKGPDSGNARNYVDCPENWVLYWINPKMLDAVGWRGWSHVRAADPRVQVRVTSMITPEGMVRRGGPTGDILAYMPKHWYETRKAEFAKLTEKQTQSSVDRMESLKDEFRRGSFPNVTLESAVHPTHTMAEIDRNAP